MQIKVLSLLLFLSFFSMTYLPSYAQKGIIDNTTVDKLELNRFLGTWYEIARFPHNFEKDLVGVSATYSIDENDKIKVINRGFKKNFNGQEKETIGKVKIPNSKKPGHLKVSFFWIFYVDYLVMELDVENYQWAVIGGASPDYLWILCRDPKMDKKLYNEILEKIKIRGYDLSKLSLVPQQYHKND